MLLFSNACHHVQLITARNATLSPAPVGHDVPVVEIGPLREYIIEEELIDRTD